MATFHVEIKQTIEEKKLTGRLVVVGDARTVFVGDARTVFIGESFNIGRAVDAVVRKGGRVDVGL